MLTKLLTGRRPSGLSRAENGVDYASRDPLKFCEHGHDGVAPEGLASDKGAGEVRSQLLFSFRPKGFMEAGNLPPLSSGETGHVIGLTYYAAVIWNERDTAKLRDDVGKIMFHPLIFKTRRGDHRLHSHDELVFVRNIQAMEQEKFTIPVRIGFGLAYCFDDPFSGEMYFSHSDHRFKTVRFLTKRELHSVGLLGAKWLDYFPSELVEGRTEIVNGVPNDKCEFWRDGFMLMNLEPAFSYFWVRDEGHATSAGLKKLGVFRMKVHDVLFRASNF